MRKSLSGDVASSSRSLGAEFAVEVKKAASYDVMATDSSVASTQRSTKTVSRKDAVCGMVDTRGHGNCFQNGDDGVSSLDVTGPVSESFISSDVRVPKQSTGFAPSGFVDGEDHISFVSYINGENISVTCDSGHLRSGSGLTRVSSSSQNIGVLETSLDVSDTVTTTISCTDIRDINDMSGGVFGESRTSVCRDLINSTVSTHAHNSTADEVRNNLGLSTCKGIIGSQETSLENLNQISGSSLQTYDMTGERLFVMSDADSRLQEVLQGPDVTYEGTANVTEHSSIAPRVLPVSCYSEDSCKNPSVKNQNGENIPASQRESYPAERSMEKLNDSIHSCSAAIDMVSQHLTVGCGEKRTSVTGHPAQGGSVPASGKRLSGDYSLTSQCRSVKHQPLPASHSVTQPCVQQNPQAQPVLSDMNKQSFSNFSVIRTFDERSFRTENEEPQCLAGNGVFILTHDTAEPASGEHDHCVGAGDDNVKYSLPELTSSCRVGIEPQRSISIKTTESNSSTPALSPSDIATLEIMLTSAESDSSQEKS